MVMGHGISMEGNCMTDITEHDETQAFTGKYEKSGRIGGWLIGQFFSAAQRLLEPSLAAKADVLEVGCGAGYSTASIREWIGGASLVAAEPEWPLLQLAKARNPDTQMLSESVYQLAHTDKSFDAIIMLEVLEHLERPADALAELARVSRGVVLLSTPREPIWRMLNMARGKYLHALGNTPGHIQHWSTNSLRRSVSPWFDVIGCATPLPWTILLLRPKS